MLFEVKNHKRKKSIIYVNFSPYDNAGRILDFLVENFPVVLHFSFDHLRLKNNRRTNILRVFQNGKLKQQIKLISFRVPEALLFPSLPLVALLIITQTFWYVAKFKKIFHGFDIYFTVNGFTAWVGNLIRKFRLVKKTIFWVWDYYPPGYPDWRIRLARWVYWKFDRLATSHSSYLIFPNRRLEDLRKKLKILPENINHPIVPIGTAIKTHYTSPYGSCNLLDYKPMRNNKEPVIIGHLGMLKWEQGLDLLFDNLEKLSKQFPKLRVEIIGSGPEEDRFKRKAKKFSKIVKFYGFVESDNKVEKIIQNWTIGLATYIPEKSNESYWTDPSKIKVYLSQGVPVITTNVPDLAKEITKNRAGIVIDYNDPQQLISAVSRLIKNREKFGSNAFQLAKKYDYKKLYTKLFNL